MSKGCTTFSLGIACDEINRGCEYHSHNLEWYLRIQGRQWGISLLSGVGRIVFGIVQIIGSIAFSVLRSLHAAITYAYDRPLAKLRFKEATRALAYPPHGGLNILRGALEALQVLSFLNWYYPLFLYQCERDYVYPYPSHVGACRMPHRDSGIELSEMN